MRRAGCVGFEVCLHAASLGESENGGWGRAETRVGRMEG